MAGNQEWHYSKGGEEFGPITAAELKKLAANCELSPTDMIWKEGMEDWKPAGAIKGLFASKSSGTPSYPSGESSKVQENQEWHYSRDGEQFGPITESELNKLASGGRLSPDDLVWKEGMADWTTAGSIKGLTAKDIPAKPTPPSLPPSKSKPKGNALSNLPSSTETTTASSSESSKPALWNPFVARALSLLLTPIFSALLIAKNWKTLGEDQRAKRSMFWVYGFSAFLLLAFITPDTKAVSSAFRTISGIIFLVWACTDAEKQVRFVKEKYGKDYLHKSWAKPVGISLAVISAMVVVFVVFSFVAEGIAPPDKIYQMANTEITYTGSIPRETVGKFAQYLVETKFIDPTRDGDQKKSIRLKARGEKFEFWIVMKNKGQEQDPKVVAVVEQYARQLSRDIFSGAIVDNHLCDENWNVLRVVRGTK